jgi:hypothetical protein
LKVWSLTREAQAVTVEPPSLIADAPGINGETPGVAGECLGVKVDSQTLNGEAKRVIWKILNLIIYSKLAKI